jgi:Ring finger domain
MPPQKFKVIGVKSVSNAKMDWSLVAVMTDATPMSQRDLGCTYALYHENNEGDYEQEYIYDMATLKYRPEFQSTNISHNRLMWWSGWSLVLYGSRHHIPVVDVSVRFQPTEFTVSIEGDTFDSIICRQVEARQERLRVLDAWRGSRAVERTPLRLFPLPWVSAQPSHRAPVVAAATGVPASATKPKPAAKPAPVAPPALPAFVVEALKRDAIAQCQSCPITMAAFTEAMAVAITPCYHLFTADALTAWLVNKSSCPMCKKVIKQDEISIK